MALWWALALAAGVAGVIQNGLSKRLSERAGLSSALHISNLIVLVGGLLILSTIAHLGKGEFASLLKMKLNFRTWTWWFLVPGIMGLFVITVAPFLILKIGALKLFVAFVFGQIIASALWDHFIEGIAFDRWRLVGSTLALAGAVAVSFSGES